MEAVVPETAQQETVNVVENLQIAERTYRIRLRAPRIAASILPGQFVMIRPTTLWASDPLLGRPFALYDTVDGPSGTPEFLDLVYLVLGRGTATLAERAFGDQLRLWGPLGNGFSEPPSGGVKKVFFIGGGIGQTPFLALGRWWLGRRSYGDRSMQPDQQVAEAHLIYGVRTANLAAGVPDFEEAGIGVDLATDDGSKGHSGYVTELLEQRLIESGTERPELMVGCGPHPMLAELSKIADRERIPCLVSLENHMACGFGACFSCVVPIREADGSVDYKRTCVEGPIVPAHLVDWNH